MGMLPTQAITQPFSGLGASGQHQTARDPQKSLGVWTVAWAKVAHPGGHNRQTAICLGSLRNPESSSGAGWISHLWGQVWGITRYFSCQVRVFETSLFAWISSKILPSPEKYENTTRKRSPLPSVFVNSGKTLQKNTQSVHPTYNFGTIFVDILVVTWMASIPKYGALGLPRSGCVQTPLNLAWQLLSVTATAAASSASSAEVRAWSGLKWSQRCLSIWGGFLCDLVGVVSLKKNHWRSSMYILY